MSLKSWLAVLVVLAACSAEKPKQASSPPTDDGGDPNDVVVDQPEDRGDGSGVVTSKNGGSEDGGEDAPPPKRPHEVPDDYEMTHNDCDVLATQYRTAWLNTERQKQEKALNDPKTGKLAAQNLERAADSGRDSWLKACQGIVGAPFLRSRLVCAAKAQTLQRFDDCWDGKAGEGGQ